MRLVCCNFGSLTAKSCQSYKLYKTSCDEKWIKLARVIVQKHFFKRDVFLLKQIALFSCNSSYTQKNNLHIPSGEFRPYISGAQTSHRNALKF